jgi:hypothetical protein
MRAVANTRFLAGRVATWFATATCVACGAGDPAGSPEVGESRSAIIFDANDRHDIPDVTNPVYLNVAKATAVLMDGALTCPADAAIPCSIATTAPAFNGVPLCVDQGVPGQQAVIAPAGVDGRRCTAFLVGPNVLVTNGPCFDQPAYGFPFACKDMKAVFDFDATDASGTTPQATPQRNVYQCTAILDRFLLPRTVAVHDAERPPEYAVFSVDRVVVDDAGVPRQFLDVRRTGKVGDADPLAAAGHPLGLPLKVADNGHIIDNTPINFFTADLDLDSGQGGSPIFNASTGVVEGLFSILTLPRFNVRTGGAPGGGDCLEYRHCDTGTCDRNLEGLGITRITSVAPSIPVTPCSESAGTNSGCPYCACPAGGGDRPRSRGISCG